jgi:hypothetical protein
MPDVGTVRYRSTYFFMNVSTLFPSYKQLALNCSSTTLFDLCTRPCASPITRGISPIISSIPRTSWVSCLDARPPSIWLSWLICLCRVSSCYRMCGAPNTLSVVNCSMYPVILVSSCLGTKVSKARESSLLSVWVSSSSWWTTLSSRCDSLPCRWASSWVRMGTRSRVR